MKPFDWNEEKNEELKNERDISFEEIVAAAETEQLIAIIDHPNQKRYPGQKIIIVEIDDYAYIVPFVEDEQKIFLKTAYPSRAATKKYLITKKAL